jgi:hypothetical protein
MDAWRFVMGMLLVMVLVVHAHRVWPFITPSKRQAPVLIDPHGPSATSQGMEAPTRQIHVVWACRVIEDTQLTPDLFGMAGINTARITLPPEAL